MGAFQAMPICGIQLSRGDWKTIWSQGNCTDTKWCKVSWWHFYCMSLPCLKTLPKEKWTKKFPRFWCCYSLNDFADSHQNSHRGAYGSGGSGRAGGRQGGLHSSSNGSAVLGDSKSRGSSGRSSMQVSSSSSSQLIKDGSSGLNQLTYRKSRNSKQQQQQQQTSNPLEELQNLSTTLPSQSHRGQSTEEQDYNRLLVAMDKDMDRPESPAINTFVEQSIQQSAQNKGNTLRAEALNLSSLLKMICGQEITFLL